MKHVMLILALNLFLCGAATAQLVVKANPGGLITGVGSASVECFATRRISGQLDGYLIPVTEKKGLPFSGGGVGLSARYYATNNKRPTGLFVSPFVAQHWISFQDIRRIQHAYNYTALGGQIGYQHVFKGILVVDVGGGAWTGLNVPSIRQALGVSDYYGEGINWWVNIGVGLVLWSK